MRSLTILVVFVSLAFAGCIAPDVADKTPGSVHKDESKRGSMTAEESKQDSAGLCTDDLQIGTSSSEGRFCAKRVVTTQGTLTDLPELDVDLTTFNGDITVKTGAEGAWSIVATLRAHGDSEADATANLANIQYALAHTDGAAHFLVAQAKHQGNGNGYHADLVATLPASLVQALTATVGNGDVVLQHARTDLLAVNIGNGDATLDAAVEQVDVNIGNGDVKGAVSPAAAGRIAASTGNGDIKLTVPEDAAHGYTATLDVGNGKIDPQLKDGQTSACPQSGPCNHREFRTTGFDSRDVRSMLALNAGNGDVSLAPQ